MTDAPRYRLVGYDIGTAPDENGGWVHWTDHEAIVARLTAERDDAIRAKDCFQRMTRAHWEALCAMRNSINEYIQMPNTDSGPLFSPEDGPIYADIAERVVADLAESRAYALALEQELHDRAEKAEAALVKAFCMGRDAAAAWHEGREQDELAIASKYRGGSNPWFSHCQSAKGHKDASDAIRALTPPADLAAKIGGA